MTDDPKGLARNVANYGDREFALYLRRTFAASMGYSRKALEKPVVGIADTASDYNNCHRSVPELVEAVKRGVLGAGALPLGFPTVSLCEPSLTPTSMHYRNLMALDTEAMLTAQPMDAAVLIGGCDKTVPAQLMAAASADVPVRDAGHRPDAGPALRGRAAGRLHRLPPLLGAATAPATSRPSGSARSRASWRRPAAPAASWAPPRPWPASPRRSASCR